MRSLYYPALAFIALLLIAIGALVLWPESLFPEWHRSFTAFLKPSSETKKEEAAPPPEEKKKAAKGKTGARAVAQPAPVEEAEPVVFPASSAPGAASTVTRTYPFPVAEQIAPGTPQSAILGQFGRPEMKVTGADKGELRERYVYVDRTTGRRTFIAIVNSVVTSAQTLKQ